MAGAHKMLGYFLGLGGEKNQKHLSHKLITEFRECILTVSYAGIMVILCLTSEQRQCEQEVTVELHSRALNV